MCSTHKYYLVQFSAFATTASVFDGTSSSLYLCDTADVAGPLWTVFVDTTLMRTKIKEQEAGPGRVQPVGGKIPETGKRLWLPGKPGLLRLGLFTEYHSSIY